MNIFRHFNVKKTRLPLPAAGLSCLYIKWRAYMDVICKEGLRKRCVLAPTLGSLSNHDGDAEDNVD